MVSLCRTKILFVGGVADGQRLEIPAEISYWEFLIPGRQFEAWRTDESLCLPTIYIRTEIPIIPKPLYVMSWEKLTLNDVINLLVSKYPGGDRK